MEWTKVKMFRTVQDPMIGPKPKQAFMMPDSPGWEAWYHIQSGTVHVKVPIQATPGYRMHIVGPGNLNAIETYGDLYGPFQDQGRTTTETIETKSKGGRPRLQPSSAV